MISDRPVLVLGAIAGERPDLFGDVAGAVRFGSGHIVVADPIGLEVRVFSAEGRLLETSGRRGEGPGEFQTIMSMHRCADDAVSVYDPALSRLSTIGLDGELIRTTPVMQGQPPPYDFYCNDDGILTYVHRSVEPPPGIGPRRPRVAITVAKPNGEAVRLGTFPASERYFNGSSDFPRPFGKETSVAVGSDVLYLGTADLIHTSSEFEIALLSFQGERVGTIRDTVAPEKVTATHTRRWINEKVGRATGDNARREIRKFFEALEYPDAFPAHGRLIVDPFDNLWVQEYLPPGEQVQTWRVYSPRGMRITSVRTPRGFRLLEAGADYVLGVRRNEVGVPFVEVHSLVKSTRN